LPGPCSSPRATARRERAINIGDVQLEQPDLNRVYVSLCHKKHAPTWFPRASAPMEGETDGG
jgi:hypothetical protein